MGELDMRFLILSVVFLISCVLMLMNKNNPPHERVNKYEEGPRLVRQWQVGDDNNHRAYYLYETVIGGKKIRYVLEEEI